MSADAEFVTALIGALKADATVQAALGADPRVFDDFPAGAAFPYAVVQAGETRPADSADISALEHDVTIEVSSRHGGKREALDVLAALRGAFDGADLAISGRHLVLLRVLSAQATRADAQTMRGTIRLRAITEEA
jgi:hypothetical protein